MERTIEFDFDLEVAAGRNALDPAEWKLEGLRMPGFTPRQQAQLEEEQRAGQRTAAKQPVPKPDD
jgi:hypothetical protein